MTAPPSPLQRRLLRAYDNSRTIFEAWADLKAPHLPPSDVSAAQVRSLRHHYAYHLNHEALELHEAMTLMGALSRLAGGTTLGDTDPATSQDVWSGWFLTLVQLGVLAGLNRLGVGPILEMADILSGAQDHPVSLMASVSDLCILATARKDPGRPDLTVDSERRAMFGALGNIATCARIAMWQRLGGWAADMNLRTFYVGAVGITIGEGR